MNQGMFNQIRDYLTSIDSRLGQLITEQKRTNELLAAQGGNATQEAKPAPADAEPWIGYDSLNVGEVLANLSSGAAFTNEEWAYILDYEKAHKNRSTVIKELMNG